ncbi:hypothetical protein [Bacillus sp. FMQ74]|uniref:hypothetical protein n=1 Tax=Bacillus sp. FMQ74 TaxID=1913579 RepID=UPI0015A58F3D|nr:hypothetical protein [Bacillus sp. FMQ74]
MEKVLVKLQSLQKDGLAVEEATQQELIDFITHLKLGIDEAISLIEDGTEK